MNASSKTSLSSRSRMSSRSASVCCCSSSRQGLYSRSGAEIKYVRLPKYHHKVNQIHRDNEESNSCMVASSRIEQNHCGGSSSNVMSKLIQPRVEQLKTNRENEKKELQELNERLAQFITKSEYLKEKNVELYNQLSSLRQSFSQNFISLGIFDRPELTELWETLKTVEKEKKSLQFQQQRETEQITTFQSLIDYHEAVHISNIQTIEEMTQCLSKLQIDVKKARETITDMISENEQCLTEIKTLKEEFKSKQELFDEIAVKHIYAENEALMHEDHLNFLKKVFHSRIKDLEKLAGSDQSINEDFWRDEMTSAISEIENIYSHKIEEIQKRLETCYEEELQEALHCEENIQEEVSAQHTKTEELKKKLDSYRSQFSKLECSNEKMRSSLKQRSSSQKVFHQKSNDYRLFCHKLAESQQKLKCLIDEIKTLTDAKLDMEAEVATFRKLLDSSSKCSDKANHHYHHHHHHHGSNRSLMTSSTIGGGTTGGMMSLEQYNGNEMRKGTLKSGLSATSSALQMSKSSLGGSTTLTASSSFYCMQKGSSNSHLELTKSKDGSFVCVKNISDDVVHVGGMTIMQTTGNGERIARVKLPSSIFLGSHEPRNALKIWSFGCRPTDDDNVNNIELQNDSWSRGINVVTSIIDCKGNVVCEVL